MFRLDIDFFPLLILVPAIVQFTICLLAGKKMRFCIGILPFAFLSFAGYGYLADRAWNLPYPGLFEPDFMMSSATAGFFSIWRHVYRNNIRYNIMGIMGHFSQNIWRQQ